MAATAGRARLVLRGPAGRGTWPWPGGRIAAVGTVAPEPSHQVMAVHDDDLVAAGLVNTHHHMRAWRRSRKLVF
jgi:cytosine/adenosine deaminase-related metal-dependent hydrolase